MLIREAAAENYYFDPNALYGFTALGMDPGVLFLKREELKYSFWLERLNISIGHISATTQDILSPLSLYILSPLGRISDSFGGD